jgi:hypothetical protein
MMFGSGNNPHMKIPLFSVVILSLLSELGCLSYRDAMGTGDNNNLISYPEFESRNANSSSPTGWNNLDNTCGEEFECLVNSSDGWRDKSSLQISTTLAKRFAISVIAGNEVMVNKGDRYEYTTHMKINNSTVGSLAQLHAFNTASNQWYDIVQCPPSDGTLIWHEYVCEITIPDSVSKVRPVLIGGWSAHNGTEAVTKFDSITLSKLS